ncbi:MAG: protein-glutamate O-methyltransferase CheR [Elusimicrobiota bacterium]
MIAVNIMDGDIAKYEAIIKKRPEELDDLFDRLTINVTEFFRDVAVWEYLAANVFEPLLSRAGEPVRIWSAGCAGGEEPYTIAIIILELLRLIRKKPEVKIIASDVDPVSLARAKTARYPEASIAKVSEHRTKVYFSKKDGYVQVSPAVTSMVQFVEHSYLTPLMGRHVDFISCRNSLIYLTKEAKAEALRNFHAALVPGGIFVLGASEVLIGENNQGLFETLSGQSSIFKKIGA